MKLVVEIDTVTPLCGWVDDGTTRHRFEGWIALVALLQERADAHQSAGL